MATRRYIRENEARAIPFQRAIELWMVTVARAEVDRLLRRGIRRLAKAELDPDEQKLMRLLLRFGFRASVDEAHETSIRLTRRDHVPTGLFADALEGSPSKISYFQDLRDGMEVRTKEITRNLKDEVQRSLQTIIQEALEETPQPSVGEIARRIRTQSHGRDRNKVFGFSSERAEIIARTEVAIARNTGQMAGFEVTGVQEVQWIAVTSDFRSGERQHWKMDGERVKMGESFQLPRGARIRFPGDPLGPVGEIVNCRCTLMPVG